MNEYDLKLLGTSIFFFNLFLEKNVQHSLFFIIGYKWIMYNHVFLKEMSYGFESWLIQKEWSLCISIQGSQRIGQLTILLCIVHFK